MEKDAVRTQKVVVSLASVLKLARDYNETKRLRDEAVNALGHGRISPLFDVRNARFLAYNNIIADLNLPPIEL